MALSIIDKRSALKMAAFFSVRGRVPRFMRLQTVRLLLKDEEIAIESVSVWEHFVALQNLIVHSRVFCVEITHDVCSQTPSYLRQPIQGVARDLYAQVCAAVLIEPLELSPEKQKCLRCGYEWFAIK